MVTVDEQEATIRPRLWRMTGKYPVPGFGGWPPTRIKEILGLQENIGLWEDALAAYRTVAGDVAAEARVVEARRDEALKTGQWVLQTIASWHRAVAALEMNTMGEKAVNSRERAKRRKDAQAYRWYVIEGRELKELGTMLEEQAHRIGELKEKASRLELTEEECAELRALGAPDGPDGPDKAELSRRLGRARVFVTEYMAHEGWTVYRHSQDTRV